MLTLPDRPVPVSLHLFGPMSVQIHGRPLPRLRSRRELWLLALLVLRGGRPVERSWLVGQLWPESTESQGLSNLRRGLTDLRAALEPEGLRLEGPTLHTLRFSLEGAEVDVATFDAQIEAEDPAQVEQAVALYRGPLLEGCVEEWVAAERRSREERWLAAQERLAAGAREHGDIEAAARWLRQVIAVDPLRETAQRALMEALAAAGNHAAAIFAYREFRERVLDELNEEPSPETTALFRQVRSEARRQAAEPRPVPPALPTPPPVPASPPSPAASDPVDEDEDETSAEASPAAAVRPSPSTSPPVMAIPRPLTALIGRDRELIEVRNLVESSTLVSLTGPGGVGKTRLAIQTAADLAGRFADGVLFVDLTSVIGDGLVPAALAAALSIREHPGENLTATLTDELRTRELLLVLDNCEHVVEGCVRLVRALLGRCPRLRVLVTSRQTLDIAGEMTWIVPALATPPSGEAGVAGEGEPHAYAAVRLFLERARAVSPTFRLTEQNTETVFHLLRNLDGIPLAIELAAARLRVLSVEQIAARLDDRFRLLTRGERGAISRHQTLRAAMDWSYQLLSPHEQSFLCRLGVFAGRFTLEAAQSVCAGTLPGEDDLDPMEVLDLLEQLAQKSLVQVAEGAGEMTYRLLETTREYAREHWSPAEGEAIQRRHARYLFEMIERVMPELLGAGTRAALDLLDAAHDNIRAALQWLTREPAHPDGELGLRMAAALWPFWQMRGHLTEGRGWLTRALRADPRPTSARIEALSGSGVLAREQGYFDASQEISEECLALCRALSDDSGAARELNNLGVLACNRGDFDRARELQEEALLLQRTFGEPRRVAKVLTDFGWTLYTREDYQRARELIEEGLAVYRSLGDQAGEVRCLNTLGLVIRWLEGDDTVSQTLMRQALSIARSLGLTESIAISTLNLAMVSPNPEREPLLAEALVMFRSIGSRRGMVLCLLGIAEHSDWRGHTPPVAAHSIRLMGGVDTLMKSMGFVIPSFSWYRSGEQIEMRRPLVGDENFEALRAEGRRLSLDEVIQLALRGPDLNWQGGRTAR